MMTLIAVAITTAYVYSSAVVFGLPGNIFFWELATLIDVMLLGHWIEMRSVMGASRALEEGGFALDGRRGPAAFVDATVIGTGNIACKLIGEFGNLFAEELFERLFLLSANDLIIEEVPRSIFT